jgi:hypothetical protein
MTNLKCKALFEQFNQNNSELVFSDHQDKCMTNSTR